MSANGDVTNYRLEPFKGDKGMILRSEWGVDVYPVNGVEVRVRVRAPAPIESRVAFACECERYAKYLRAEVRERKAEIAAVLRKPTDKRARRSK